VTTPAPLTEDELIQIGFIPPKKRKMKDHKSHILYKTTRFDGKYYIGIHSTNNINDGYMGSGLLLRHSVKKYGRDAHITEVLEILPTREELKSREIELLTEETLSDIMCFNIAGGGTGGNIGGGGFFSDEHRQKFHTAGGNTTAAKRKTDESFNSKINTAISKGLKEFNQKHPGANLKAAIAASKAAASEKSKAKRAATNKERGFGKGERNPRFGTILVNDGLKNISINKELLDEYLQKGFVKGMIKRKLKE